MALVITLLVLAVLGQAQSVVNVDFSESRTIAYPETPFSLTVESRSSGQEDYTVYCNVFENENDSRVSVIGGNYNYQNDHYNVRLSNTRPSQAVSIHVNRTFIIGKIIHIEMDCNSDQDIQTIRGTNDVIVGTVIGFTQPTIQAIPESRVTISVESKRSYNGFPFNTAITLYMRLHQSGAAIQRVTWTRGATTDIDIYIPRNIRRLYLYSPQDFVVIDPDSSTLTINSIQTDTTITGIIASASLGAFLLLTIIIIAIWANRSWLYSKTCGNYYK